ncbi:MAG: hypothetical protein A2905_01455 [Candidatus Levybacteria bacterium RIFCSPLOWO2_01_FULL_36_10]|nr:MAG: hypothetical protein A2905_01455 [Candidatus Levybacteria bacterium RIFCSPLOWO2_01_FULL_36_10]
MKKLSRYFVVTLILGLILRMVVMFWAFNFRENTDILHYKDWGRVSYLYGPADTYKHEHLTFDTLLANNQPPLSTYIIMGMYYLQVQTSKVYLKITHIKEGSNQWINGPMLNMFLRIPSIIADIIITFLIYMFVKKRKTEKTALLASGFFLFNPAVIYNSAFWGQMDAINNLFFYLSLFLICRRKYQLSIYFFLLSLYTKLSLIFVAPIFFLIVLFAVKSKRIILLKSTFISFLILYVATLPISLNPIDWFTNYVIKNSSGVMDNITAFAFNFWWFIFKPMIKIGEPKIAFDFSQIQLTGSPLSSEKLLGLSFNMWALLIFLIVLLPLLRKIFILKEKIIQSENLFLFFSTLTLIGFLFLPRMHERYIYPVFPLLATSIGFGTNKIIIIYILLSLMNMINLYLVWHPMLPPLVPYFLMSNQTFQWIISGATLLISLFLYKDSLKLSKNE